MAYRRLSPAEKLKTLPAKHSRGVLTWDLDWRTPIGQRAMGELLIQADALGGWDELSPQKQKLVSRITYLSLKCSEFETSDLAGQKPKLEPGVYSNYVNVLGGLLSKLGLERVPRTATTLRAIMAGPVAVLPKVEGRR
jgi:hypothetical protein